MSVQLTDFTIGWISALEIECVAACELLDEEYENDKAPRINASHNHAIYTYGRIQKHNLVIASLPYSRYGTVSAARVAERLRSSFPALRLLLMVGIAGGAPSLRHDIRLGDVVVSCPTPKYGGVIQYDYGKIIQMQEFEETGYLTPPPDIFLNAIGALKVLHRRQGHHIQKTISHMLKNNQRLKAAYSRPGVGMDRLYKSDYVHLASQCDCLTLTQDKEPQQHLIQRYQRSSEDDDPAIHYGLIASANQLVKDATLRDTLARKHDVLCFETEAAGLMDASLPCIVIRGISDYADSHKNDDWQGYAAATAASYAKELLNILLLPSENISATGLDPWISTKKSDHPQMHFSSPNGVNVQVFGGALASAYSIKDDLDVRVYLEDIRNAFIGNTSENQEQCINICIKLKRQADQIQAEVQASQTGDGQQNQLFLNCVSRCVKLNPFEASESLSKLFSGVANYSFERGGEFFPEEYSLKSVFQDKLLVMDYKKRTNDIRSAELFLYCAVKPRRWQRMHVLITLEDESEIPIMFPQVTRALRNMKLIEGLSEMVLDLSDKFFKDSKLTQRVTQTSVPISRSIDGAFQYDYSRVTIAEDYEECDIREEQDALAVLRASGCPMFQESQFVILKRKSPYEFLVTDGKNKYMMHKAHFATPGAGAGKRSKTFLKLILKTWKLTTCDGVSKCNGVVLDDSWIYITGFIQQPQALLFKSAWVFALSKQYTIPRDLRRYWAKQIIKTVKEVHAKGDYIGKLMIFITEETSIELSCNWDANPIRYDSNGHLAPELREQSGGSFTQESDIFWLGIVLWELSEHVPSFNKGYLCAKAGCTVWPSHHCQKEAHRNPVSLPFSENTDPLLRNMIEQCRQKNPDKRPTAEDLSQAIGKIGIEQEQLSLYKAIFRTTMNDFMEHIPVHPFCDACYALCIPSFFSCHSCNGGNFDICQSCVTKGLHCLNEAHQLIHSQVDAAGNTTERFSVRAKK